MQALVGIIAMDETRKERLIGHGFIRQVQQRFASGVRAAHFEPAPEPQMA